MDSNKAYYYLNGRRASSVVDGLFPPEHGRLSIRGQHFFTADGKLAQIRCASAFLLFYRWTRGEDITPDLRWYRAHGFNTVRVMGPLPWAETPDYRMADFDFQKWDAFCTLLEAWGIRVNFSMGHYSGVNWAGFEQAIREVDESHWCLLLEKVNEPHVHGRPPKPNPEDEDDLLDKRKPDPVDDFANNNVIDRPLTSYGYYKEALDGQPGWPRTLDFGTVHTPRDRAHARRFRIAQEAQRATNAPWWNDEGAKVTEPDFDYVGGKNDPETTPREICWYAGGCYLWMSAFTYHFEEGKWGRTPQPGTLQQECAEALRDNVFLKMGPEIQVGEYNRGGNGDSPVDNAYTEENQVWTYTSLHDKDAWSIRFGNIPLEADHGWRIVDTWGPKNAPGTFARLER